MTYALLSIVIVLLLIALAAMYFRGQKISQEAEKIKAAVQGQKKFLGDVAHELCSPLARLRTGLSILENRVTDDERKRIIDVSGDADELAKLVEELLEFTRSTLGQRQMRWEQISVADSIKDIAAREAASLQYFMTIDEKYTIKADKILWNRAIGNVLRNAQKYAGENAEMHISLTEKNHRGVIHLRDNGSGVSDSDCEKLFEPFFRPDAARTREAGGTGLGLAIVKSCVEGCGGKVSARNAAEGGFEIMIEMPLC